MEGESAIARYMEGQAVLVTGGTGFLGKVFVEKLLRSCPDLGCVLLIIRPKSGLTPKERWDKMCGLPLFDKLRNDNPKALDKVVLIDGDISKEDLGLSEIDKKLLIATTTLIYHAGASVRFDSSVVQTLKENTRSTFILLEMAKQMVQLKVFVYVSTAYANMNRPETEWKEEVYPSNQDWRVVLKLLESESESLINLQDKLIVRHPNTYTYSKNMAENIAVDYSHLFPVIIFRPSVVFGVTEEPLPGWADGLTGLTAVCISTGIGFTRVINSRADDHQDVMPADKVSNGLIAVAWLTHKRKTKSGVVVYNCASGEDVYFTNRDFSAIMEPGVLVPSKYMIWPPVFRAQPNTILYLFLMFITMAIPYFIVDRIRILTGRKPRLTKIVKKMALLERFLRPFKFRKFCFPKEKYRTIQEQLEGNDKKEFNLDFTVESKVLEVQKNYLGILKYYFHEELSDENIQKNAIRHKKLILLQKVLDISFFIILIFIAAQFFNTREFLLNM